MRSMKTLAAVAMGAALIMGVTACTEEKPSSESRNSESEVKNKSYDQMVKNQPAESMGWSPTRDTINFWAKTWEEKNKLSYVYLQSGTGEVIGYYVLQGLPVSYCAMLTPPETIRDKGHSGSGFTSMPLQAPSIDGVYYANGGSLCSTYYGQDATTGAYLEYTVGMGINVLLFDQPMDTGMFKDAEPLGYTTLN